ncbi:alpha/beta hydrolase fold family protein [Trichoderma camerunense]
MAFWNFEAELRPTLPRLESYFNSNEEFRASSIGHDVSFGITCSDIQSTLLVTIQASQALLEWNNERPTEFTLAARSEDWKEFFSPTPKPPYQSYWGILRILGSEPGVGILGDAQAFGRSARLWRLFLDTARRHISNSKAPVTNGIGYHEDQEEDSIVGRYIWLDLPIFGRTKIFYETAGEGPRQILWLHTAGADSREYHDLMNNKSLQERYTMYSFDLPGHGRSYPGQQQLPQGYANDEDTYVEIIHQVIKKLRLHQPIVSGASMAGHVCLAVAIRAKELGIGGVIPVEAAAHLPLVQPPYELGGHLNESVINPERVCGMIAPTTPEFQKRLIWWIYSSQAAGIFQGDLKFYFRGWDGRGRIEKIDTKLCPVYMLTGEYDYSCSPEVSGEAAAQIPGARFEKMERMGHFPMTENPQEFMVYLNRALEFIEESRSQ